ncbi:hypothetical protein F3Y22_tig00008146pilonHSYRG00099 [Hibiscus syriacus]|uniref:Uncharacterized protein n=1 Tax=Hibiscus syriacus TaxID=106335 RepID=A0A6A3CF14_HIBSY|nr:hypothetical protein F3Y22_tig00008146pilonHSYRG00099 [Hibiscus syriacus]
MPRLFRWVKLRSQSFIIKQLISVQKPITQMHELVHIYIKQILMAGNFKSSFFVLLFLLTWLLFPGSYAARPLNVIGGNSVTKGVEPFFDWLSLEGIKTGGPSAGGKGHAFTNAVTNSGPSSELRSKFRWQGTLS